MRRILLLLFCCALAANLCSMNNTSNEEYSFCEEWLTPDKLPDKLSELSNMTQLRHLNFFHPIDRIASLRQGCCNAFVLITNINTPYAVGLKDQLKTFFSLTDNPRNLTDYYWVLKELVNLESINLHGFVYDNNISTDLFKFCESLKEIKIITSKGVRCISRP